MTGILDVRTTAEQARLVIEAAFAQITDPYASPKTEVLAVQQLHDDSDKSAVWEVTYGGSFSIDHRDWQMDRLREIIGADVYPTRDFRLYVAHLNGEEEDPALAPAVRAAAEHHWRRRWNNILPVRTPSPYLEHSMLTILDSGEGRTIRVQPFVVQQGCNPVEFQKYEEQLRSELGATFLTVTPFVTAGGAPEPRAFTVNWSRNAAVWRKPWEFEQRERVQHVLWQARLNTVFELLGWNRPTLSQVWLNDGSIDLEIDLYGLTVASDVIEQAERVRQLLGAATIAVSEFSLGCTISLTL